MHKAIRILAYIFGTVVILVGALFLSEAAFESSSPEKVQFITWYPIVGTVLLILGILIFYGAYRGTKRTPQVQ
jgi:hypothetical protein